jgi:hypothetical protein
MPRNDTAASKSSRQPASSLEISWNRSAEKRDPVTADVVRALEPPGAEGAPAVTPDPTLRELPAVVGAEPELGHQLEADAGGDALGEQRHRKAAPDAHRPGRGGAQVDEGR